MGPNHIHTGVFTFVLRMVPKVNMINEEEEVMVYEFVGLHKVQISCTL